MLKNSFKKIGAVVCAFAVAAQLAVVPANAAYINEDQSIYMGDLVNGENLTLETSDVALPAVGSLTLNGLSGNYTLSVDAVFNGVYPAGSTAKGEANSTYFYFGTAKPVGSHMMVQSVTADGFTLQWKSDRVEASSGKLLYGQKYNIQFKLSEIGTGAGAQMMIYIYNEDGTLATPAFGGGLRNYTNDNKSSTIPSAEVKVFTTAGNTSSLELSNVKLYREVGDEIVTKLDGNTLDAAEKTEIELSNIDTTTLAFSNVLNNAGAAVTGYTLTSSLKMADGTSVPKAISIQDGKIVADVALEGADAVGEFKEYDMLLTVAVAEYPEAKVVYPVVFKKAKMLANDLVGNYNVTVSDVEGAEVATGAEVTDDLTLDSGSSKVSIEWSSSDEDIISSATGVVLPAAEDTEVTLTARVSSAEVKTYFKAEMTEEEIAAAQAEVDADEAAWGQIVEYTYTVKGIKAVVDAAIADMKFVSNDVADKEMDFSVPVNEDFKLPESYAADENVVFDWKTDDTANVTLKNGVATLVQKTLDEAEVSITGTVSYVKNNVVLHEEEVEQEFVIDMTQDGTADKYIVRCDAAASKNFANCPDSGDTVKSADDICDGDGLPTKGIFGSKIEWTSSVPSAISNTGKSVKKQSVRKLVTLTATISKGDAESATYKIEDLVVPSSSGASGSGSGSGSSSNSNTSVSSTGNKASNVSYKGTLAPTTSLQKGDVTTATVVSFSDLGDAAWAKEAVTFLANKAIINGKTSSSFAPNDDITRAEFAKIVVKAFGLEDANATVSNFSDVSASDWYYTAVASAYNKGIIKGYEDGRFGVNDKITRQDMAVIIYRAAQVAGKTIAPVKDAVVFADNADIASYAAEAVATLQKGGVINGMTATTFAPTATATRAQAAQMIYGLVK